MGDEGNAADSLVSNALHLNHKILHRRGFQKIVLNFNSFVLWPKLLPPVGYFDNHAFRCGHLLWLHLERPPL